MINDLDSLQLEAAILGNCIVYPEEAFNIVSKLGKNDFMEAAHQEIFEAIYFICQKGQECEIQVLTDVLKKQKKEYLFEYLGRITNDPIFLSNKDYVIKQIKNNSSKQKLHSYSRELYDQTQDYSRNTEDIISEHYGKLAEITPKQECISDAPNSVLRFQEEWKMIEESGSEFVGIESGLRGLDQMTRGFRKSSMVTIAAGTNVGKTHWALNMAIHNLLQGKSVLYFSLEMIDTELMRRLLPMLITDENITIEQITNNQVPPTKKPELDSLLKKYSELKLSIDWGTKDVDKILMTCETHKRSKHGLDLIIIDHIQLLHGANEPALAANNTNKIKNFALVNQIPILVVSQFNRLSATRQDKLPQLWDLKGSGAIEQDSDTIIFLHKENKEDKHITMICRKHRQATQAVNFSRELMFDSVTGRLVEQLSLPQASKYISNKKKYPTNQPNPYEEAGF